MNETPKSSTIPKAETFWCALKHMLAGFWFGFFLTLIALLICAVLAGCTSPDLPESKITFAHAWETAAPLGVEDSVALEKMLEER